MRAARTGPGRVTQQINMGSPVAYTPVVTWAGNTIGTQSGVYIKLPGLLLVWVSFVESAGTAAATCTITIPTGYTVVTLAGSLAVGVGSLGGGATTHFIAAAGATTQISSLTVASGVVLTWCGFFTIPTLT